MLQEKSISQIIFLHLIAIFFVILNVSNIKISGFLIVMPMIDLMMVFYFTVFRQSFGLWFIFLLGIWSDALNGNPLGTTSLCYILITRFFLMINHKIMVKENFNQIWRQFIFFCLLFLLMKWMILSFLSGVFYGINVPLIQLVFSSLVYVVMHKFFDYLSQKLLSDN